MIDETYIHKDFFNLLKPLMFLYELYILLNLLKINDNTSHILIFVEQISCDDCNNGNFNNFSIIRIQYTT